MKLQYSKMKLEYIPEKPKLSPRDVIGVSVLSMTGVALILIAIFLMSISLHAGPLGIALPGMLGLFILMGVTAICCYNSELPPRQIMALCFYSIAGAALIMIAIFLMSISLHAGPLMVALPGMLGLFCLISAIAGNFFRLKIPYDTPASGTMPQTYDDTLASSKMLKIPYAAIANGTMHQTSNNSEENCVYVYL